MKKKKFNKVKFKKFKFKHLASLHKKDEDKVAKRLMELQKKYGELQPHHVVNDARNSKSPLHHLFTWNKDKAAEKLWLIEAREIIRKLLIATEVNGKVIYTRAFVNIQRDDENELTLNSFQSNESTYLNIGDILKNPKLREYALERAYRELESFERKYANFEELCIVIDAIQQLKGKRSRKAS